MRRFVIYIFLVFFPVTLLGQVDSSNNDGITRTTEGDLGIVFDEFTGELQITVNDISQNEHTINGRKMFVFPAFMGNIEKNSFLDILFGNASPQEWGLAFISEQQKFYDSKDGFVNSADTLSIPFLVNNDRMTVNTYFFSDSSEISLNHSWFFNLSEDKWNQIASAHDVKFRIEGQVTEIPESTLLQMTRISNKINELRDDTGTEEAEEVQEGVTERGDERGLEGDVNVDQGTGNTDDSSPPYQLHWEGELDRTPQVQPLPSNPTNQEATVTIRFQVNPDGSIGQIFPLKKMNPEFEREVMSALRSWRFSRLPPGVPQEPQWGTITFRFVLD
jgi:TonB family protein